MRPLITSPWFVALVMTSALIACGGGDDDPTPVDPPQPTSNLADCHNPSMYTVGSRWTVIWDSAEYAYIGGPDFAVLAAPDGVSTTYVLEPPPAWGLPQGTVRLSEYAPSAFVDIGGWQAPNVSGKYVRVQDGGIDTVLTATWTKFSKYSPEIHYAGYVPALTEPIRLGRGETYQSPAVPTYVDLQGINPLLETSGSSPGVRNPPLDGSRGLRPDPVSLQLTYVGRETLTVPAGSFSTCHTRRLTAGLQVEEWIVAEGPYKGIAVKSIKTFNASSSVRSAKAISADWK